MKNVLLTGASRGVGLAICTELLKLGYTVYAVSRSMSDELKALQNAYPTALHFKSADLSNPENAVKEIFFDNFVSNSIKLYGLVNNAAEAYDDIATNISLEKMRHCFDVNLFSSVLFSKYAIRNMIYNHSEGSIVHISSICAHTGFKGLSVYAATKGAIEAFSVNLAREWGRKGIRSNCIAPGFMKTSMSASLGDEALDKIRNRTSLGKFADLKDIANAAAFLLSEQSASITGTTIRIDSGSI